MVWLFILCGVLAALSAGLMMKVILMRRAADEIRQGFEEKLKEDTNTLISISSGDKAMRRLAGSINIQLRALRRSRHRYVQGDLELKNAITNISHDIRTPLTAVCAYLDLLDACEKSAEAAKYLAIIRNRTEMLGQLTEELFCYSVTTAPNQEFVMEEIVMNGVLEESIAGFYAVLQEKNIMPKVRITEKKIVRRLNRDALLRVFANIINNAVKYSDGDLEVELTELGEVIFSNRASRLNEVQVGKLFDRFYTVEASRKSTGLGLSIAKTLTERMNGTILAGYENGRLWIKIVMG